MTFNRFLQEVCPGLELDWRKYRRRSAKHRVDARVHELRLEGYGEYLVRVLSDSEEARDLPDLMRVTVSRFFREREQWSELRGRILSGLVAEVPGGRKLHAWSAGCCGGEEPFTLALVWLEHFMPAGRVGIDILATDIDGCSLERARLALYRPESLREVPADVRHRWFHRENALWRLDEKLRTLVRFEERNLLADPPPTKQNLILCRYLPFTYYRGERLHAAARRLWEAMRPEGILMVGAKERLCQPALELFEQVAGTRAFYRRKGKG